MSKYLHIAELLKARIAHGDYDGAPLPGAQSLAVETACSYMTVRQALQKLISDGVLLRLPNGRLVEAPKSSGKSALKVALVRPAWGVTNWDNLIYSCAKANACSFKLIYYNHPMDEAIYDSFDGDYDLIFMCADFSNDSLFLRKLERNKDRVVTLFQDFTGIGIRCVDGVHPKHVEDLLLHLKGLGHGRIDFIHTGLMSHLMRARTESWSASSAALGLSGDLRLFPCESFQPAAPAAKRAMDELISSGSFSASAIICSCSEVAVGSMRSFHERALSIPGDVSVCCFGDAINAALSIPSITTFSAIDHSPEVKAVFDFFLGRGGDPSRLMYRTSSARLIQGESSGPCKHGGTAP